MKTKDKYLPERPERGSADIPAKLRVLDSSQLHAVLCTVGAGVPYASLVAYALTPGIEGAVFATPRDSRKYRNIMENRKVCLLIDTRSNTGFDYRGAEAMTIEGTAVPLKKGKRRDELSRILTLKHPGLSDFVSADGTALVFVEIERCVHVSQFQKVTEWHR